MSVPLGQLDLVRVCVPVSPVPMHAPHRLHDPGEHVGAAVGRAVGHTPLEHGVDWEVATASRRRWKPFISLYSPYSKSPRPPSAPAHASVRVRVLVPGPQGAEQAPQLDQAEKHVGAAVGLEQGTSALQLTLCRN